ncbi:MAG: serine/threonine protein kinase [Myxococcaceae bacterium]|nr:serine/threonine protein kinase [Myxococcaceae bacterium]
MSSQSRPPPGPVPIQRYGKYYLVSKLAEGGMAEIFLAKQVGVEGFEKNVVVKRMLAHLSTVGDFVSMFLDEARLASRLAHPNVVQVLDLGFEEGCYFIAMEYLAGEDFSTVIRSAAKQRAWVPLNIALKVLADAATGLHYAHEFTDAKGQPLNVVHRDVSPSNILVTYSGQVKVLDFGIAKAESRVTNTTAGVVKGKYQYMAPEQAQSLPIDRRADVYSLGVCMYEALCNARPFARDTDLAILNAVLKNEYRPARQLRPDLPVELEQILVKALAREPADRFQSAGEFAAALENYLRASTSVTSGTAISQYMASFFGPERVASRTRIDSLEDLKARGVLVPELEKSPSNPSGPSLVVPGPTSVSQNITVTVEESTRSIGAPRSVTGETALPGRPLGTIAAVVGALLIGAVITFIALKSQQPPVSDVPVSNVPVPNAPVPNVPVPPPEPVVPAVVVDAGGVAEPLDAGAPEPVDAGAPDKVKPAGAKPVVLSTPIISQVIRKNAGPVVKCFQEHKSELPAASGKVDVTITIERSGRVRDASSAMSATPVGQCLEGRLKQIRFPAHVDESVTVTLPLNYKVQ